MSDKTSLLRGPKSMSVKTRLVTRAMSTATVVATLPKGARILGFVLSGVASDAGTSSVLNIGSTSAATQYVNTADLLAAGVGDGVQLIKGVAGGVGAVLTVDTPIYVKVTEVGTASTAGAWKLHIIYTTGNITNDTTI